jgi:drug/metabolite transporter (DMT)-like permease
MPPGPSHNSRTAYLLLAIPPLVWAGNHVLARAVAGYVPPGGLSMLRWLLAALILLPFAWSHLRRDAPRLAARPVIMLFLAMTGAGVFGTIQFIAAEWASALNMSVINSTAPIMILLAGRLLFGDRLRPLQLVGVAISTTGLLVLAAKADIQRLLGLAFERGDLLLLANMGLWAIYCACLRLRPDVHWLSFTFAIALLSGLGNLPLAVWEHVTGRPLVATGATIGAVLYAGICTSVIAYAAWNRGVELIGAARASAFLHLIPIFGAGLATTLLGERLEAFHIVGCAMILGGVSLAARPPRAGA